MGKHALRAVLCLVAILFAGFPSAAKAGLTITGGTLDFGYVRVLDRSATMSFTLTNTGPLDAILNGGSMIGPFETVGYPIDTLAAGASVTVWVVFRPTAFGAAAGALIYTDGITASSASASFSGVGVPRPVFEPIAGDLNADGMGDLVWDRTDGTYAYTLMNGITPFALGGLFAPSPGATTKFGKFAYDGKMGFVRHLMDGSVVEYALTPYAPSVVRTFPTTLASGDRLVGLGDFNGDGITDLVIQFADGSTEIWDGLAMTRTVIMPAAIAAGWYVLRVADFNGDGMADLLWTNPSGAIGIWTMNGTTALDRQVIFTNGSGWTTIGIGDFNGDAKADLLFTHTSGAIGMWLMDGTHPIARQSLFTAATGWFITHVGDLDGDGKTDLVWTAATGETGVWLMNGLYATSRQVIVGASPGNQWNVALLADLNGDGRHDILWTNILGDTAAWVTSGSTTTRGVILDHSAGLSLVKSIAPNNGD